MELVGELAALAATGKLGAVQHGVRLADVAAAYGDPVASGRVSTKRRWPHRFCFGGLETVFCRCRMLSSLTVPLWRGELELPGPDRTRTVASRITESEMTAALRAGGCRWDVVAYETLTDQRALQTAPTEDVRVGLVFTARESRDSPLLDDWILNKVNVWSMTEHECPPIDPSLPDDGYGR
ncbi:hypothetical protein ACFQLX_13915 [Streptomyces polyrhachis]|uniref:Uncharacterized protein n=1 Tax=Streptomyces polyrhachis TaxID=1282885 RepID=A0ABW2GIL6_9ACTN